MATGSSRVIYAALIGNGIIMVIKFMVAILTRSSAMMAEAVHSLADMGNQGLLLLGIRLSRRPADQEHAFGHGKEQYFWSFLVANLLFSLGALFSIYEGLNKLLHPHALERVYLIYLILGAAIIIEGYSFSLALGEFFRQKRGAAFWLALKESKDPNLIVVLVEDAAALAGLLIAFFGTVLADITGLMLFDGVASIIIGLILAAVALYLANEMRQLAG